MEVLYLTVEEAGRVLSLKRSRAYECAHADWKAFTIQVGRNLRVNREALLRWAASQTLDSQDTSTTTTIVDIGSRRAS